MEPKLVRHVVFAVRAPKFIDLPGPEACVIAPLKWETRLVFKTRDYCVLSDRELAFLPYGQSLQDEVERLWLGHQAKSDDPVTSFSSYFSKYAIKAALCHSAYISRVIEKYPKSKVWIPKRCDDQFYLTGRTDDEEIYQFLAIAPYIALRQFCGAPNCFQFLEEDTNFLEDPKNARRTSMRHANRSTEIFLYASAKLLRQTTTGAVKAMKLKNIKKVRPETWLILGQPAKSADLLRRLKKAKIRYNFVTELSFEQEYEYPFIISKNDTIMYVLHKLLCRRDSRLKGVQKVLREVAEYPWAGLLTDHEYDARARVLIDAFLERGMPVALYPEGAVPPRTDDCVGLKTWYFNRDVMRFHMSAHERDLLLGNGFQFDSCITGYLGNTTLPGLLRVCAALAFLYGRITKPFRKKPRILVSLELYSDFTAHADELSYTAYDRLLSHLNDAQFSVYVKSRHDIMTAEFRNTYANLRFFTKIPWQLLLHLCDVVISRESSVTMESLRLQKPVIIWDPFNEPLATNFLKTLISPFLRFSPNERELEISINDVLGQAGHNYGCYDYFCASSQQSAVDWVRDGKGDGKATLC